MCHKEYHPKDLQNTNRGHAQRSTVSLRLINVNYILHRFILSTYEVICWYQVKD